MFDRDALIIEGGQAEKVSILSPDRMDVLSVSFQSPLFGLWTPAGKGAPFLCIEPWYGRADRADFEGSIEKREYDNCVSPGDRFSAEYTIEIAE
jgi:galactose mutarotase-like enzyme